MLKIDFFAIVFFPFCLLYEILHYRKCKIRHTRKFWILRFTFYCYIISLINVTLFPIPLQKEELELSRIMYGSGMKNNFIPFKSIVHIFQSNILLRSKLLQIGGNILLLLPLTFYLPLIKKKFHNFSKSFLLALTTSISIELVQLVIGLLIHYNYRTIDVDDIILNVIGGTFGYCLWRVLKKPLVNIFAKIK